MYEIIIKNEKGRKLAHYKAPNHLMIVDINEAKKKAEIYPTKTPKLLQEIKDVVNNLFSDFDPFCDSRLEEVKKPRQIAHFFGWWLYNQREVKFTAKTIGRYMGLKDHATVLHSVNVITGFLGHDKATILDCRKVASRLGVLKQFNKYLENL